MACRWLSRITVGIPRGASTVRSQCRLFVAAVAGMLASATSQQLSLRVNRLPRSPNRASRYGYASHAAWPARSASAISSGSCGIA